MLAGATVFMTVAAMFLGITLLGLAVILSGVDPKVAVQQPLWLAAGAFASQASVFLVVLLAWRTWQRVDSVTRQQARAELFPMQVPRALELFGALLICFGVAPLAIGVATLVGDALGVEAGSAEVVRRAASAPTLVFCVLLVCISVLPGVVEEALFRGFVTRLFLEWPWLAWVLPSLLFGLVHLDLVQSIGTTILGLGFGWIRLRSASIVPAMFAHASYNGVVLIAARLAPEPEEAAGVPVLLVAAGCAVALLGNWLLGVSLARRARKGAI